MRGQVSVIFSVGVTMSSAIAFVVSFETLVVVGEYVIFTLVVYEDDHFRESDFGFSSSFFLMDRGHNFSCLFRKSPVVDMKETTKKNISGSLIFYLVAV